MTQQFGQQATSAWGKFANNKLADAIQTEDEAAIACWSANGACRIAGHGVIGALGGGLDGALGSMASTAVLPDLDRAVASAGLTGAAHDAVVAGLAGSIGSALGGLAGAAASFNEVNNNYLSSKDVNYLAGKLIQCALNDAACRAAVRAEAQSISSDNDRALLACKDQACVDSHISVFVGGAKAFSVLYSVDDSSGKYIFGALSDMQTVGGLIAANMSAGFADYGPWRKTNCSMLSAASCETKYRAAAVNGEMLRVSRDPGILGTTLLGYFQSTVGAHQYAHTGQVCDGSETSCNSTTKFNALLHNAGPGGTGMAVSGGISQISFLGLGLGYVTHLVDQPSQSVVNITLPSQHGLDPGWVIRYVESNSYGGTAVNSYGAGTGANPANANVWSASIVWGGNVQMGVRPIASPNGIVNEIMCQKFGSC